MSFRQSALYSLALKAQSDKAEALAAMDSTFFIERNSLINESIESFIVEFDKTRHTVKERSLFEQYKQNIESLKNSETAFINSKFTEFMYKLVFVL